MDSSVNFLVKQAEHGSPVGFVFDIDGVLLRGNSVIPAAQRTLQTMYDHRKQHPRLPLAFLTNGGGVTEEIKAKQLSDRLGVRITTDQIVLSHTPFQSLTHQLATNPVLVIGRGDVEGVAKSYGLEKIITTRQLAATHPAAVPFWQDHPDVVTGSQKERQPMKDNSIPQFGTEEMPIHAVLVFSDPSDWYIDIQIVVDIVAGGGVLGRSPNQIPTGNGKFPKVHVYFSNPDLLWANNFPAPRFGQGAFAACVETLYEKVTGLQLDKTFYGKPNPEPYVLVERLLLKQARALGQIPPPKSQFKSKALHCNFGAIFAVGDNCASDIQGAHNRGEPWVSMLVKTGVFNNQVDDNCSESPADFVVDDVEAAVDAARIHLEHSLARSSHKF